MQAQVCAQETERERAREREREADRALALCVDKNVCRVSRVPSHSPSACQEVAARKHGTRLILDCVPGVNKTGEANRYVTAVKTKGGCSLAGWLP